jgi:hypothetical protein
MAAPGVAEPPQEPADKDQETRIIRFLITCKILILRQQELAYSGDRFSKTMMPLASEREI